MRILVTLVLLLTSSFSLAAPAPIDVTITTQILANDANGVAEDQTLGAAGNLTLDGDLCNGGICTFPESQRLSFESTGTLSGVDLTVTCRDNDGVTLTETLAGPDNETVTTAIYCYQVTQIAADGAIGTAIEAGPLAANGMITRTVAVDNRSAPFNMSLSAELSAGTGTFGAQYSVDTYKAGTSPSYNAANWRDARSLDPDTNTATGDDNIIAPVKAVRGRVTVGSTTGVYKFTFLQGDPK